MSGAMVHTSSLASGSIPQMKNSSGSTLKGKSSISLSPLSSSGSSTSTSMIHGISQVSFFASLSLVNYHLNHHDKQDSWAICRIFKKTNLTAQRTLSHSWVYPPLSSTNEAYIPPSTQATQRSRHCSENTSSTMTDNISSIQFTSSSYLSSIVHSSSHNPVSIIDSSSSRPAASTALPPSGADHQNMSVLSAIPLDLPAGMDITSMVLNVTPTSLQNVSRIPTNIEFGQPQHCNSNSSSSLVTRCTVDLPDVGSGINGAQRSINFPFNMQGALPDDWRMTFPWDSLPCTTELSAIYHSSKCYT